MDTADFHLLSERLEMLLMLRREKEAAAPARELVAAFPESAQAWLLLSRCLISSEKIENFESLDAVNRSIGLDPHDSFAFVVQGWILWLLEHPKDARVSFEQALRLNPESMTAHTLLAKLNYSESRIEECWDHVIQGLAFDPHNRELLTLRAELQLQRENLDNAEEIVLSGLQHHPDYAEFHSLLGQIHIMRSEFLLPEERLPLLEQSRTALREAQRLNPNRHETNSQLYWLEKHLEGLQHLPVEETPVSYDQKFFCRPIGKEAIDEETLSWKQHFSLNIWEKWYELKDFGRPTVVVFCLFFFLMFFFLFVFAINP